MADYNNDDLIDLFTYDELFDSTSGGFSSVVDYSPSDVYEYMITNSLIGNTILKTFINVYDDLRTTNDIISFLHGSVSYGDPSPIYSLYEAITTYIDRGYALVKVSRRGCHSMTRIMVGMLRSVNISGIVRTDGKWYYTGHSSAEWQCTQLVIPYGAII